MKNDKLLTICTTLSIVVIVFGILAIFSLSFQSAANGNAVGEILGIGLNFVMSIYIIIAVFLALALIWIIYLIIDLIKKTKEGKKHYYFIIIFIMLCIYALASIIINIFN